jgi:hypothetical protein
MGTTAGANGADRTAGPRGGRAAAGATAAIAVICAITVLAAAVAGCGASGGQGAGSVSSGAPSASAAPPSAAPSPSGSAPASPAPASPATPATPAATAATASYPPILIDTPAPGGTLPSPGRVTGTADVFEAQLRLQVLDGRRNVLIDVPVQATCGTGCRGTFDVTVRYTIPAVGWGTLRVFDLSAKDGTPADVSEYPVWLTPSD